jgi:hypothetical protein
LYGRKTPAGASIGAGQVVEFVASHRVADHFVDEPIKGHVAPDP